MTLGLQVTEMGNNEEAIRDFIESIRISSDFVIDAVQHLLDLDVEEAYKDYARSLRDNVDILTQEQRSIAFCSQEGIE